jgi:spoIIIJ-associated protein
MEERTQPQVMSREAVSLTEEHIRRLLDLMGFADASVQCTIHPPKIELKQHPTLQVDIAAGQHGRMLIGVRGAHLYALQHMIRAMVRRHVSPALYVAVDINNYLASRERMLSQMAEQAARQAGKSGRAVVLPPMVAAERHTVHAALAARPDIRTESLGEEPNRRVVVRPVFI